MTITLNRPEVLNAVNLATHLGVGMALEEAEHDPDIRVVILTGAGEMTFCAQSMQSRDAEEGPQAFAEKRIPEWQGV